MYFAYGFPKSYRVLAGDDPAEEVVYASFGGSDHLLVATTAGLQLWTGGQQRVKIGETRRDEAALAAEGRNVRAWWCPARRVIAVATDHGHLLFYGLNTTKEVLWRTPDGQEAKRVSIYLQNGVTLGDHVPPPPGAAASVLPERVADLFGDGRSLVAVLENGTMLVFSWSAKLRCVASPFQNPPTEASGRSRLRHSTRSSLSAANSISDAAELPGGGAGSGASLPQVLEAGEASATPIDGSARALASPASPTDAIAVRRVSFAPATRLLAAVLHDGRVALISVPSSGLGDLDRARLARWAYTPPSPSARAVAAAVQPAGNYLAVGLAHGRVAIYSVAAVLAAAAPRAEQPRSPRAPAPPPPPPPDRLLSLAEWGYSSAMVGPAHLVQWSPDGRVVGVGYALAGLAVWTPSGCRVMCTLRQAAQGMLGGGAGPRRTSTDVGDLPAPATPLDGGAAAAAVAAESPSVLNPQFPGSGAPTEAGILEGGVAELAWSPHGYSLLAVEAAPLEVVVPPPGGEAAALRRGQHLLELSFARGVQGGHRVSEDPAAGAAEAPPGAAAVAAAAGDAAGASPDVFALQAADRLLLVLETSPATAAAMHAGLLGAAEAEAAARSLLPDLTLQHVRLPQQYLDAAFPVLHVSVAPGSRDIAVAGTRGLAVLNCRTRRWRLFGDAMQERRMRAHCLAWLPRGVVAVAAAVDDAPAAGAGAARGGGVVPGAPALAAGPAGAAAAAAAAFSSASSSSALLLFPKDHLDFTSLLTRHPLRQAPAALDAVGPFLAVAFAPLDLAVLRVDYTGRRPGDAGARATLTPIRELSIRAGLGGPLADLTLLSPPLVPRAPEAGDDGDGRTAQPDAAAEEPTHAVVLRGGGTLSVLDLGRGTEAVLADEIESYWLPVAAGARPAAVPAAPPPAGMGRDDSAAAITGGGGDAASPAAKGAAWLERRNSGLADHRAAGASPGPASASAAAAALAAAVATALAAPPEEPSPLVEMPWWTYGSRGMQLWFPSSLFDPDARGTGAANATDPELEFDREVYPLGIALAEVSIVGMMQRTARSPAFPAPSPPALCLQPHPESQPVLPCLLRRLLEQGRAADALELATRHSRGPHFARSLEWLLFTALEADVDAARAGDAAARRPRFASPRQGQGQGVSPRFDPGAAPRPLSPRPARRAGGAAPAGPALVAAARLVQSFPQAAEIVVSVARKTDAALWPALFSAAGPPAELCDGLLGAGALQTAACCLLIVDQVEGAGKAHGLALRLVRAALGAAAYGLAADILRFLMPPGEGEGPIGLAGGGGDRTPPPREPEGWGQGATERQGSIASGATWLWGFFSGADKLPVSGGGADADAGAKVTDMGGSRPSEESMTERLHRAASALSLGGSDDAAAASAAGAELGTAVAAWRLMGRHAWKLLDSGALRELAAFGAAMSDLHGGLPALLSTAAGEVPLAVGHATPSAAAIASALFVASNEFATAEGDGRDAAAEAEGLRAACAAAGCVNHAAALALMLGDAGAVEDFAAAQPRVWGVLADLVANDVHLCAFAGVVSPGAPGTPLVVAS